MALPSSYRLDDGQPIITGVQLRVIPDAPYNGIELQRTSDKAMGGGAATSAWASVAEWTRVGRIGVTYLDVLPRDHGLRYYQARAKSEGFDASAWTAATTGHTPVRFTADELREQQQQYPLVAGNPAGNQATSDLYLPSGVKLRVGTTGASATIVKDYIVSYVDFIVAASTPMYDFFSNSSGYLAWTASSGQPVAVLAPIHPPVGVTWSTEVYGIGATLYMPGTTWAGAAAEIRVSLLYALSTAPTAWVEAGYGLASHAALAAPTSVARWFEPPDLGNPQHWAIEPTRNPTTADSWAVQVQFTGVSSSAAYGFRLSRAWVKYKMGTYDAAR